jgi:hypothetical protein
MLPPASIAAGYETIGSKLRLLFFRLQLTAVAAGPTRAELAA